MGPDTTASADEAAGDRSNKALGGPEADRDEELLLAELRGAVARFDPPPPELAVLGEGLFSWLDPTAELAALVADSRELAGSVRGAGQEVLLRFDADEVAITLEAIPDGAGGYELHGQVEPGEPGVVEVRQAPSSTHPSTRGAGVGRGAPPLHEAGGAGQMGNVTTIRSDEWGRFDAQPLVPGALSIRWTPDAADRPAVLTAWVVI
jgi:hypothetical protein